MNVPSQWGMLPPRVLGKALHIQRTLSVTNIYSVVSSEDHPCDPSQVFCWASFASPEAWTAGERAPGEIQQAWPYRKPLTRERNQRLTASAIRCKVMLDEWCKNHTPLCTSVAASAKTLQWKFLPIFPCETDPSSTAAAHGPEADKAHLDERHPPHLPCPEIPQEEQELGKTGPWLLCPSYDACQINTPNAQ